VLRDKGLVVEELVVEELVVEELVVREDEVLELICCCCAATDVDESINLFNGEIIIIIASANTMAVANANRFFIGIR
jgi:hypothetical protein